MGFDSTIQPSSYAGQVSFFGGEAPLPLWVGFAVVLGFGAVFSVFTTAVVYLESFISGGSSMTSEKFKWVLGFVFHELDTKFWKNYNSNNPSLSSQHCGAYCKDRVNSICYCVSMDLGGNSSPIIKRRMEVRCLWTFLVCIRCYNSSSIIWSPCHFPQKGRTKCAHR